MPATDAPVDASPRISSSMRLDKQANNLLTKYGGSDNFVPIVVPGDGNCLFHALSVCHYGNMAHTVELRVRCCIELMTQREHYDNDDFDDVAERYEVECCDTARDGKYAGIFSIMAASTVLKRPIQSIYPPVNGMTDPAVRKLNMLALPRVATLTPAIRLMWTYKGVRMQATWTPNHFAPLFELAPQRETTSSPPSATRQPPPSASSVEPDIDMTDIVSIHIREHYT